MVEAWLWWSKCCLRGCYGLVILWLWCGCDWVTVWLRRGCGGHNVVFRFRFQIQVRVRVSLCGGVVMTSRSWLRCDVVVVGTVHIPLGCQQSV